MRDDLEHWPHPVEQPIGPHVQARFTRMRRLAERAQLLPRVCAFVGDGLLELAP